MFRAVLIVTTLMGSTIKMNDVRGPYETMAACKVRVAEMIEEVKKPAYMASRIKGYCVERPGPEEVKV